jgi:hypothetical protein
MPTFAVSLSAADPTEQEEWNNLLVYRYSYWKSHSLVFSFIRSDPGDWAYNRMDEERKNYKTDYVTIDNKQIALTVVWSIGVVAIVSRLAYALSHGEDFYAFGPWTGSY